MQFVDIEEHDQFLFRYRSYSVPTVKELTYNELYFSSTSELNDPYDTRLNYIFGRDEAKFARLLESAIHQGLQKKAKIDITIIAKYLAQREWNLQDLLAEIQTGRFQSIADDATRRGTVYTKAFVVEEICFGLLRFIHRYIDRFAYTCSFSRTYDSPTIWSHYADQHKGFALVFQPYQNRIYQDPRSREIKYVSETGATAYQAPPKAFNLERVRYSQDVVTLDAFLCFTEYIYGAKSSKEFANLIHSKWREAATTKYSGWVGEDEWRLVEFDDGFSSALTAEGKSPKSSFDRVVHYDPTQFGGVMFGSKMEANERTILKQVVYETRRKTLPHAADLPFFYFLEAVQIPEKYELDMKVHSILDDQNSEITLAEYKTRYAEHKNVLPLVSRSIRKENREYAMWRHFD